MIAGLLNDFFRPHGTWTGLLAVVPAVNRWAIFARPWQDFPSEVSSVLVTYRFDGPADDIHATLVVRLHHTVAFQGTDLWKAAADFNNLKGIESFSPRLRRRSYLGCRIGKDHQPQLGCVEITVT